MTGGGGLIVKVSVLEVPPPGAALKTLTTAVPELAMSKARMEAVNPVPLTNVVVRFEPFQRTTDPFTKFAPFTVSVKAAPPAVAVLGLILVSVGRRLLIVRAKEAVPVPPALVALSVTVD